MIGSITSRIIKKTLYSASAISFLTLIASCAREASQTKKSKHSDCKDPNLDMYDAPVHAKAEELFNTQMRKMVKPEALDKMKLEDQQQGVISLSDFLSSSTPEILPLSQNLSDCILANKPTISIFGEVHESAPDLVTLKVAKNLMDKGEKVHFVLEIPEILEQPIKKFLKKEISEEEYGALLLQATLSEVDIAKLNDSDKSHHIKKIRDTFEHFPAQLQKMGIDYTCVDDPYLFEVKEYPNVFGDNEIIYRAKNLPMTAERDKRIAERTSKIIDHVEGIKLCKIGLMHAYETQNTNIGDFPEYGINSQYSMASLLADKYGRENVFTSSFSSATIEASGFKYTDYDRIFNWKNHEPLAVIAEMLKFSEMGIPINMPNFEADMKVFKSLTEKN